MRDLINFYSVHLEQWSRQSHLLHQSKHYRVSGNEVALYLEISTERAINTLYESYLNHLEASVLHDVPDHGHDLGRELPLLQLERRADDGGVGLPVGTEHMVRRNIGKYWLSEINKTKFELVKWRNILNFNLHLFSLLNLQILSLLVIYFILQIT